VNDARFHGTTALYMAAQEGHVKLVEYFITQVRSTTRCASPEHVDVEPAHTTKGGNLAAAEENGITPAEISAQQGHVAVLDLLLEKGGILRYDSGNG